MNPLQSLYYISPACLGCLLVPFGAPPSPPQPCPQPHPSRPPARQNISATAASWCDAAAALVVRKLSHGRDVAQCLRCSAVQGSSHRVAFRSPPCIRAHRQLMGSFCALGVLVPTHAICCAPHTLRKWIVQHGAVLCEHPCEPPQQRSAPSESRPD